MENTRTSSSSICTVFSMFCCLPLRSSISEIVSGNFSVELDLEEDDSEVGRMVKSISFMKRNLVGMMEEITDTLEQMGELPLLPAGPDCWTWMRCAQGFPTPPP